MVDASDFRVVERTEHYSGYVIDVRTDSVRMPDGTIGRRDVIAHPGAVAVVAIGGDGQVVMVRQYRHPVGEFLLELPAGLLDVGGEPALEAAQRELFEEAALTAARWDVLVDLYTSPGMTDEAIRIFLARDLSPVPESDRFTAEHEEMTMTVERFTLPELVAQIFAGHVTNGPAVAGILAASVSAGGGWADLRPADSAWPARPQRSAG
ncbi:NUDIX hydrolase [Jatrophihabitans telluris]|uniref:NUDIX hydrolase n=1 Tax=Jatrophihabitans telluris TaxID=2038343 RepID=A0ABY4R5I6_9ACTN|nr:NUDIX hydrolase [Jatrophihabitans telluris]UQX90120.1 NUDIX hydrolase [Jatrophihabitans telluris]